MRRSTAHLALTTLVLVCYLGIVVSEGPRSPREVFPAFKWELFSMVPPPVRTDYGVRLVEVNGERLDPPLYFEESIDIVPLAKAPEAYNLIQSLGRQVEAGHLLRAAGFEDLLEAGYFTGLSSVEYEVVKRTYDIVDRVTCRCFIDEQVVGTLVHG